MRRVRRPGFARRTNPDDLRIVSRKQLMSFARHAARTTKAMAVPVVIDTEACLECVKITDGETKKTIIIAARIEGNKRRKKET